MENTLLFEKYKKGEHWKNHPVDYSERFSRFLKKSSFRGLLVDLGCGYGRDVNIFSKNRINVLGIDISKKKIDKAKHKYPYLNFEVQDIENLRLKDESVSAFFMINVIHYLGEERGISEILRTLKTGGYLFIHFNLLIEDEKGQVDYKKDEKEILQLFSDFKIIEKRIIYRLDKFPFLHKHKILELILQKSKKTYK